VNDQTYQKLEFQVIREALARFCGCGLGKSVALKVAPSVNATVVRQWLAQVEELLAVAKEYSMPPMAGVHDVREEVRACAFPAPLEPEALAKVGETLDATASIAAWFTVVGEKAPQLRRLGERITDYGSLAAAINEAIDPRGEVRDYASEKLSSIRAAIGRCREDIRKVFERLLTKSSYRNMLQYAGSTFHSDRMVLPLKAEYRGRIPGIVHRSSDSGATLFVEPAESVELNNSIIRLREAEQKEITRILRELCRQVDLEAQGILKSLRAMAVLDLVAAKARYGEARSCVCPIVDDTGVLELHEARHPVLLEMYEQAVADGEAGQEVVPIDVRLGEDFDVLAITGPNTGGKTVALKTVGLLTLMAQAGIPIPAAEGSRIPVFRQVFVDIGDEQSLQQSLSTFSSHLSNLLSFLGRSGAKSLVLIDELGAGTDPDEGAAIGRAIITELLRLRSKVIVTTHLSALKAIAYTAPRVDNACVEFDVQSLRPTYRLHIGEPGSSNALIIAGRLGMSPRMVKIAEGHLDGRHRALDKAIAGTLDSRRESEKARREARQASLEAKRLQEQYQRQRDELERAQHTFEAWTQWVNHLTAGDEVFVRSLKRTAKVVRMQLHKQSALVSAGALDIEVPIRDIDEPGEEDP
jgi:DNA mismatch repair protein MutS2